MKARKLLLGVFFSSIFLLDTPGGNAQDKQYAEEICTNPKIRTILFYRTGWEFSMPVFYPGEDETLELCFDYLDRPEINFNYSISNCTYDWQVNEVKDYEFIEGFNDIAVDNYQPSRNTTRYFTHYSIQVPGEGLKLLRTGNYLLKIYDRDNPEEIILTRRFCIAEKNVDIKAQVRHLDDQNQEIALQIDIGKLGSTNPTSEVKVVVLKNYSWNNQVTMKGQAMLRDNMLFIDMPDQLVTSGDNEYRFFDTKNTKFESERVEYIEYRAPEFCFVLKTDELKQYKPYLFSEDLNGRFYIEIPDANDRHLESDYVQVSFTLDSPQPLGTDVYIYGALTGWQTNESNFMVYNTGRQAYEKTLLLKQGYYNYAYATRDFNKKTICFDLTEGNHSETENDYLVFVYLRKSMDDFDRLAGYSVINSSGITNNMLE